MKRRRPTQPPPSPAATDRLAGIRPVSLDDGDERPSREDRSYGETIFTRPSVPLPRFLTGRRKQPPR